MVDDVRRLDDGVVIVVLGDNNVNDNEDNWFERRLLLFIGVDVVLVVVVIVCVVAVVETVDDN